MKTSRNLVFAALAATAAIGCSDEGEGDGPSSSSTTTSSSSSTSSAGGGGAGGGDGGGGGAGGGAGACLPESVHQADFALAGDTLCVVERVDAPGLFVEPYGAAPSWGRHGGLLTLLPDQGGVTLIRWSVVDGALLGDDTDVAVAGLPGDAFIGEQAVDLPGTSATAFAWTGSDFFNEGGLVVATGSGVSSKLLTGGGGLAASATGGGRLFHAGLSAIGGAAVATVGLYAADLAGGGVADGAVVEAWGLATGPTAVDADGHVLSIQTDYLEETQELRLYAAADVAPGSGAAVGTALAVLPGYGDALAVMAPSGARPGLVFLQRNEGALGAHRDVELLRYTPGQAVSTPATSAETVIDLAAEDTNVTLTIDDQERLWLGVPRDDGAVFYVLARTD